MSHCTSTLLSVARSNAMGTEQYAACMQEVVPVCAPCTQILCLPASPIISHEVLIVARKGQAHEQHSVCIIEAQLICEQRVIGVIKNRIFLAIILQDTSTVPAPGSRGGLGGIKVVLKTKLSFSHAIYQASRGVECPTCWSIACGTQWLRCSH